MSQDRATVADIMTVDPVVVRDDAPIERAISVREGVVRVTGTNDRRSTTEVLTSLGASIPDSGRCS